MGWIYILKMSEYLFNPCHAEPRYTMSEEAN